MMRTNQKYINEFSLFEEAMECYESAINDINVAMYNHTHKERQKELKSFFEGAIDDEFFEEKEGGILTRIGEAIIKIVNGIANFLSKTVATLTGRTKGMQEDAEIVTKIINEHPELKNQICEGLKEEWFTYKDVASFQKDIAGLINMLDKNKIDHQTFMQRVNSRIDKFNENARPIISAKRTISNLLGVIPSINKGVKENRDAIKEFSDTARSIKEIADRNYNEKDANKFHAISNAIAKTSGILTEECKKREAGQGKIASFLKGFKSSKVNNAIDNYNDKRATKHDASRAKAKQAENAKIKAERDAYYKDTKAKAKENKARANIRKNVRKEVYGN